MSRLVSIRQLALTASIIVLVALGAAGCDGPAFDIETPPQMIELNTGTDSLYVAMTHDNVVVRARTIRQGERRGETPSASHEFWVDSIRRRMRLTGGYELLDEVDVESANGRKGTRLEFGRDQNDEPYHYQVTIFVTDDHIHLVEAGGRTDRFEAASEAVDSTLDSYVVHR